MLSREVSKHKLAQVDVYALTRKTFVNHFYSQIMPVTSMVDTKCRTRTLSKVIPFLRCISDAFRTVGLLHVLNCLVELFLVLSLSIVLSFLIYLLDSHSQDPSGKTSRESFSLLGALRRSSATNFRLWTFPENDLKQCSLNFRLR